MIRITKLHVVLLGIIVSIAGIYFYQIKQEKHRAAIKARQVAELRRLEAEKQRQQELEKKERLAIEAVAVAGEYWLIAKKEGRDITKGQKTLREAKYSLNQKDFDSAYELARQSIVEFKSAPLRDIYYKVRRGDSLWKIAKMPQHYKRGSMWVKIWRANEEKIPDFDLIHPHLLLLIPKTK